MIEHAQMTPWLVSHAVDIQAMSVAIPDKPTDVEIQAMPVAIPEKPTDTVKRLFGREPRTMDLFLQENADRFR